MDTSLEKHQNPEFSIRSRYTTTFAIYLGNICLGCGASAFSPVTVDFANKYGVGVDDVSVVFTVTVFSYMFGALLTSFIYNFISRQFGVVIWLSGMGISLFLIPHGSSLTFIFVVAGGLGVCLGAYDASQVVWVMEMWKAESGPFIQAQHFCFAIGGLIPPIIMAPFLSSENDNGDAHGGTTSIYVQHPDMWIPFTAIGILMTVSALVQLCLLIFNKYVPPPPEIVEGLAAGVNNNFGEFDKSIPMPELKSQPKFQKLKLVLLSAAFLGFYQGMEVCNLQFMSTFAQFGSHGFSETNGAHVLTTLSGAYAVGRGIGIVAILKIPAHSILIFNIVVLMISNTMLLLSETSSVWLLWIGAGLLGIGFSTVYPSYCAYIERHLVFTNAVGAFMLVIGALVGAIYPIIIGSQIEENAQVLTYVNYFSLTCFTIALIFVLIITRKRM